LGREVTDCVIARLFLNTIKKGLTDDEKKSSATYANPNTTEKIFGWQLQA